MFLAISGVTTGVILGVVISGVALIKDEVLLTVEELVLITGIETFSFLSKYGYIIKIEKISNKVVIPII
jgi:hypothetical protein